MPVTGRPGGIDLAMGRQPVLETHDDESPRPSALDMRIPPLLVTLLVGLVMLAAARWGPAGPWPAMHWPGLGLALVMAGVAVALAGVLAFRRHQTSVNPLHGDAVATLVDSGIYRVSRNPMYVGFATWLVALACALGSPLAWLGPLVHIAWLTRWQIIPEERLLAARFGQPYLEYCRRVRRWI